MDPKHVANAYKAVAIADHYLVGVVGVIFDDTLEEARQLLVHEQEETPLSDKKAWEVIERALILIEFEQDLRTRAASRGEIRTLGEALDKIEDLENLLASYKEGES